MIYFFAICVNFINFVAYIGCEPNHAYGFMSAKIRKMIEIFFISVLIIAIAAILLGVKLIFRKNGEFSSFHIHDSKAMHDRGIHCVMDQDREQRMKKSAVKEKSK